MTNSLVINIKTLENMEKDQIIHTIWHWTFTRVEISSNIWKYLLANSNLFISLYYFSLSRCSCDDFHGFWVLDDLSEKVWAICSDTELHAWSSLYSMVNPGSGILAFTLWSMPWGGHSGEESCREGRGNQQEKYYPNILSSYLFRSRLCSTNSVIPTNPGSISIWSH